MKRSQPGDCSCCPSRWFCKEICSAAEIYISIDEIDQNPNEFVSPLFGPFPLIHADAPVCLTKKELEILTLMVKGLDRGQVAKAAEINRHSLRTHIYNIRKKYFKN